MCACVSLCTTVVHNTAWNSSANVPSNSSLTSQLWFCPLQGRRQFDGYNCYESNKATINSNIYDAIQWLKSCITPVTNLCQIGRNEAEIFTVDIKQFINYVTNSALRCKHKKNNSVLAAILRSTGLTSSCLFFWLHLFCKIFLLFRIYGKSKIMGIFLIFGPILSSLGQQG